MNPPYINIHMHVRDATAENLETISAAILAKIPLLNELHIEAHVEGRLIKIPPPKAAAVNQIE